MPSITNEESYYMLNIEYNSDLLSFVHQFTHCWMFFRLHLSPFSLFDLSLKSSDSLCLRPLSWQHRHIRWKLGICFGFFFPSASRATTNLGSTQWPYLWASRHLFSRCAGYWSSRSFLHLHKPEQTERKMLCSTFLKLTATSSFGCVRRLKAEMLNTDN